MLIVALREAKVGDFQLIVLGPEKIFGLQVTVEDAHLMYVCGSSEALFHNFTDLVLGEAKDVLLSVTVFD